MTGQGEIEGIDNHGIRNDGGMCIILHGVNVVLPRERISGFHLCCRSNLPANVKVLKQERPASLVMREFAGVFQVGEVLMVGEDRDQMGGALQVLFPLCKGKDDS